MKTFKQFILESEEGSKLKHLTHVEDKAFEGSSGTSSALSALSQAHNYIKNGESGPKLTMKYDGSPSIVYGHHPETGRFFVASKSAFNKNPKINYTPEDIDQNHGHAPGLVEKLKSSLQHLPKITPKHGVYQGDLMFTDTDVVNNKNGSSSFTPNTITYTAKGEETDKVKRAKLGVVTHTQYHGDSISSMSADPNPDHENFSRHPDVYSKTPEHDTKNVYYSEQDQKEFNKHLSAAQKIHDQYKDSMYPAIERHSGDAGHLSTYINHTVKTGEKPSAEGLKAHIASKYNKAIEKLKTQSAKDRKIAELKSHLDHIETNSKHYNNLFKLHGHLQKAKNVLVKTLNQHEGGLEHHIDANRTNPEGFVFHPTEGSPVKLVNREKFSKANLLKVRK